MAERNEQMLDSSMDPLMALALSMGDGYYAAMMPGLLEQKDTLFSDDIDMQGLFYAWDPSTQTMDWDLYAEFWRRHWREEPDPFDTVPKCHTGCDCGSPDEDDAEPWCA